MNIDYNTLLSKPDKHEHAGNCVVLNSQEGKVYKMLMPCKDKRMISQDVPPCHSNIETLKSNTIMHERAQKPKQKRQRQPETWKRNIMKKKREAGEEYVNLKGEVKPRRVVRPGCESSCTYSCSSKFTNEKREEIKNVFYSLTDDQKYQFYNEYTLRKNKERTRSRKEMSRRKYSYLYFLPKPSLNINEKVCKKFFCATLDISVKRVYHFYKNKDKNIDAIMPTPQKGKFVKRQTDPAKIEEVVNHIKSFPVQESHYCTQRHYLDPGLSIAKMYALYAANNKAPVKENIYRKVFNEKFNLSFHRPKKAISDIMLQCCK